jgi:hypothetical protein
MSDTYAELSSAEAAAYGGMGDAIGGIATAVLAIVALTGFARETMAPIATIVFGAALLIQGGTILSEYAHVTFPTGSAPALSERFSGSGLSAVFLVGATGMVLGLLGLLGIAPAQLTAIAIITFGSALVLSSNSVSQLYALRTAVTKSADVHSAGELLAAEIASSSSGIQMLAGLATIVLGILAVAGYNPVVLTLVALLLLGVTAILTGSALSGLVLGFMRPVVRT